MVPAVSVVPALPSDIPPPPSLEPPPLVPESHVDPALEARLPREVNDVTLAVYSLGADDLIEPGSEATWDTFLGATGRTRDDLTYAAAVDPHGSLQGAISATRLAGASTDDLLAAGLVAFTPPGGSPAATTKLTLGGKSVTAIASGLEGAPPALFLYAEGDILFAVTSPDQGIAEQFFAGIT